MYFLACELRVRDGQSLKIVLNLLRLLVWVDSHINILDLDPFDLNSHPDSNPFSLT